ncbi:transcription elongation factor GreA [Arenicella chitinivorans]|uniref:Transcription elongation factor GreA n=1 Tax=Arenicella chitinivorans TaxID=1329800 RepID=A0A918VIM4_9GAMM|nr:transcription elongation factor GreA [Arenicella chitinivorans]GGZ99501.1 transcription elongation factor GreA [Arenicella chitinivorans]
MDRVLLTKKGAEALQAELKNLKSVERPKVIEAIAEARSHGDLSENAEYDAAKEQQGFVEGRIKELESHLSIAEVIDPSKLNVQGKVVFGTRVTLYDIDAAKEVSYQIVGDLEADIDQGQISLSSPIGRALIGKSEGDEFTFEAPSGEKTYEVVSVSYDV